MASAYRHLGRRSCWFTGFDKDSAHSLIIEVLRPQGSGFRCRQHQLLISRYGQFRQSVDNWALFKDPATLDVIIDFIEVTEDEAVANVGGTDYGMGLIIFAPGLLSHHRLTVGFYSIIAMDPQKDILLVALTNLADGAVGDEQKLMGHVLQLDE